MVNSENDNATLEKKRETKKLTWHQNDLRSSLWLQSLVQELNKIVFLKLKFLNQRISYRKIK